MVTSERLDEAIKKLLPTHMQLIMGIGTAEELALAEVKAEEAMKRTTVEGSDADDVPADAHPADRGQRSGGQGGRGRSSQGR